MDAEMNIAERRRDLENTVSTLRQTRGTAVVDGVPTTIPHDAIIAAEAELAALDDAESELVRRQRAAAKDEAGYRRAELLTQMRAAERKRVEAVHRAEQYARAMRAELLTAFEAADEIRVCFGHMQRPAPLQLARPAMASRLAYRLSGQLRGIVHPARFGGITLALGPAPDDSREWIVDETTAALDLSALSIEGA